jgi:hypothetical protein
MQRSHLRIAIPTLGRIGRARLRLLATLCGAVLGSTVLPGCSGPQRAGDPIAVLNEPGRPGREYLEAMSVADRSADSPAYRDALRRMVVSPNYVVEARRAAYGRLKELDPKRLADVITANLAKMDAVLWREELCDRIASEQWRELTPALVHAWAAQVPAWATLGKERPERLAIAKMYGEERVVDALLDTMAAANPLTQTNLRMRCWQLALQEGQEARLRALLEDDDRVTKDPMLRDIRAGVRDFGVLPSTREEILWLQALRAQKSQDFWSSAQRAIQQLSPDRRAGLELRDIPVAATCAKSSPKLLTMSDLDLERFIEGSTGGEDRRIYSPDFEGYGNDFSERLSIHRPKLTWGDRAAMALAIEALAVPAVRRHVFEMADRDLADRGSEFGGLIRQDDQGRYELVEYPSASRGNDVRYEAPQKLMDSLYTGLFHVHFHAQTYEGHRYAGPHMGDFGFADSTRLNCLVFTFIDSGRLNVDYYRHGKIVVDLGVIERPESR